MSVAIEAMTDLMRVELRNGQRWVCVGLRIGPADPGRSFVLADGVVCEMDGLDGRSKGYGLRNWQGGVMSGARHALRQAGASGSQVRLHELRGALSSGDIDAIANAAAIAVGCLLGQPMESKLTLDGWTVEVKAAVAEIAAPGLGKDEEAGQ